VTELQQNRYDQLLRRVGGLIGAKSMVNDALTELFPMIDVENLNAELALPAGTRLAFGSISFVASAGDLNHAQLFNPAGSGSVVILERVDIRSSALQDVRYGLATAGLTNFTANQALRDTREGILTQPVAQVRDVQQVGGIAQFGQIIVRGDITFTLREKRGLFVLGPGTGITFATTLANTTGSLTFLWRERVAEQSELNFP